MKIDPRPVASSRFSEFLRSTSPEERQRVYLAVRERARARQLEVTLRAARSAESLTPEDGHGDGA